MYDFGDFIPKKRIGDEIVKEPKPSSLAKKETRYKTATTQMSASKDSDFVLGSTSNIVTQKFRGSVEITDSVEHGIVCALALSEKLKLLYQGKGRV